MHDLMRFCGCSPSSYSESGLLIVDTAKVSESPSLQRVEMILIVVVLWRWREVGSKAAARARTTRLSQPCSPSSCLQQPAALSTAGSIPNTDDFVLITHCKHPKRLQIELCQ